MAAIQFNLLPDVKLRYLNAQKTQKTIMSICLLVAGVSVVIFLLMAAAVYGLQRKQLSDANDQITVKTAQLKATPNLAKILTVRNQLTSLATLQQDKHLSSKIFSYLPQLTPTNVNIGQLTLNFAGNTMTIDGTADSAKSVNVFIDTLKFTTYTIGSNPTAHTAFPSVVESAFGVGSSRVGYTLSISFDAPLFANNLLDSNGKPQTINLKIPKLTSTRSVIDDPSNTLFNGATVPKNSSTGGQ